MAAYLAKRLGQAVFILIGITAVPYVLVYLVPADPARQIEKAVVTQDLKAGTIGGTVTLRGPATTATASRLVIEFGNQDVVRHKLVQRIVAAYNEFAEKQAPALRQARRQQG